LIRFDRPYLGERSLVIIKGGRHYSRVDGRRIGELGENVTREMTLVGSSKADAITRGGTDFGRPEGAPDAGPVGALDAAFRPTSEDAEPSVSIVIPAKNEERNLPHVLQKLPENCELILVDGNSTDDTVRVARELRPDITVVQQTREGKGNALACGFAAAKGDFIVMIDADGSNDPGEIPSFIEALKGAHFAKGSRFVAGGGSDDITFIRRIGNFWLNRIVNVLYGTRYTDLCYGYNAFRRECLEAMRLPSTEIQGEDGTMLWGDGFEVETLINVRIAKAGLTVTEVPSFETARHFGASNLNAFSDGIRVLRTIHSERDGEKRKFVRQQRAARDAARSESDTPYLQLGEEFG
jgi:glycosyl transferase family 2